MYPESFQYGRKYWKAAFNFYGFIPKFVARNIFAIWTYSCAYITYAIILAQIPLHFICIQVVVKHGVEMTVGQGFPEATSLKLSTF